ncbi:MAG: LCP family protein [Microbacteriaceae bacterium]
MAIPSAPRRPRYRLRRVIAITVAVVVLLALVLGGYVAYNYWVLTSHVTHVNAIPSNKPKTDVDGAAQNILLVGDDHRPANASAAELAQLGTTQDGGGTNTDTMMILHIPAGGASATLISLPRDSWVDIPGNGMGKLNSAFSDGSQNGGDAGGAQLLIETVQNLTGLTIDHYVRISMLGFYDVANALGPIQVCLNAAVDDPYSGASFPAGVSTLNAQQALAFVRQRHGLPGGDLDREVRQQYFLSVEAHKLLSAGTLLNPVQLNKVLSAIGSAIETDPGLNLLTLAAQLQGLTGSKIASTTIPITGTPTITVDGTDVSIVQVDTAAMPAFIRTIMGTPDAYTKATAASPSSVSVTVLNGSDSNGVAAQATETLKAAGFQVGTPGDGSTLTTTTIEYPAGQESQAKAVAAYLAGGAVQESASVKTVTVVLGTDGIMPAAPSATAQGTAGSSPAPTPTASSATHNYSTTTCIN